MSEQSTVSYDFEQLEPSAPPPGNTRARLLAQAAAEAEAMREHARAEGLQDGLAAGREQGAREVSAAVSALAEARSALQSMQDELAAAIEHDAIELGLALAAKILAGAAQARPELIAESVQGALRRMGARRRVTVLVNPQDLELVERTLRAEGVEQTLEGLDLQAEERVAPGASIVRSEEGEVDASVQTQLERAREVVLAELQAAAAG